MIVVATFAVNSICNFAVGLLVAKFLGPEEFGRFALAFAIATFLNGSAFDWIRLSATRFYAARTRNEQPNVRATLDAAFALTVAAVGILAIAILLAGIRFELSSQLIGISVAAGIANALYDYHTALVRARFLDKTYGRLVLTKNVFALALTVGGAWLFGSATCALMGICLSIAGALVSVSSALGDPGAKPRASSARLMRSYALYGIPIITAMVLYQLMVLVNRGLTVNWHGFAETGQFSLAFDIGWRILATIGSAFDVLLFQIAVKYDETHGSQRAREQVAHNLNVVFAFMLPTCVGCWLVLPSFQAIAVPAEFQGPFGHYLQLLLPGLAAIVFVQYAINPMFQIVKRTVPLIAAAVIACATDAVLIFVLPHGEDASSLALAQSIAMVTGAAALLVIASASRPVWPPVRDIALTILGSATMALCLAPLRGMPPGPIALMLQVSIGVAIIGGFVTAFDIAGLRRLFVGWLNTRTA